MDTLEPATRKKRKDDNTLRTAKEIRDFVLPVVTEILGNLAPWHHQCHAASLAIVRSQRFLAARVARGTCTGVGGQHSWVTLGGCFDKRAIIIDPTLWSFDPKVTGVFVGSYKNRRHLPHGGFGEIWNWGKPQRGDGPTIDLTPAKPLSTTARAFLGMLGPLDRAGWATLAHAPPNGWPAGEIFAAMDDTPGLSTLVPIDMLGMLTDRNPGGLFR